MGYLELQNKVNMIRNKMIEFNQIVCKGYYNIFKF